MTDGNSHCDNYHIAEDKIDEFTKKISDLESKLANASFGNSSAPSSNGTDMASLNKLLNDYMKKSEMDDILKRLEKVEKKSKKAKDMAIKCDKRDKKWKPKWKQMEKDIDELKAMMSNKTDCSLFDSEIEKLKDLINQLASSGKEIKAPIV
jgi:chromosome segregation ATPase